MGYGPNHGCNGVVYKRVTWDDLNFKIQIGERLYEAQISNLSSIRDKVATLRYEVHTLVKYTLLTSPSYTTHPTTTTYTTTLNILYV